MENHLPSGVVGDLKRVCDAQKKIQRVRERRSYLLATTAVLGIQKAKRQSVPLNRGELKNERMKEEKLHVRAKGGSLSSRLRGRET